MFSGFTGFEKFHKAERTKFDMIKLKNNTFFFHRKLSRFTLSRSLLTMRHVCDVLNLNIISQSKRCNLSMLRQIQDLFLYGSVLLKRYDRLVVRTRLTGVIIITRLNVVNTYTSTFSTD